MVDQSSEDWPARLRAALGGNVQVDVAFDGIGGRSSIDAAGVVRSGGRYSNYGFAGSTGPASLDLNQLRSRNIQELGRRALPTSPTEPFVR